MEENRFLPINADDMKARGWACPDFVYVTGDAYVDHPSFGVAIISRVLEDAGFNVAVLSQPDYRSADDFKCFGRPRLGFLVTGGNIDSMVAHYTVSKKKRSYDYYSAGGKMGKRPDRAVIVYCNRIREAYGDVPIIIGGLEASLRRFAHYDYWSGKVRRSILVDSRADILSYGMGEKSILRIAQLLDKGVPVKKIHDVRGTVYLTGRNDKVNFDLAGGYDYDELKTDKKLYADAFALQYNENDHVNGRAVTEYYGDKMLVQNPPMPPLEREELDRVYALPYTRAYHPVYESEGGVPGINEVEFSITHNRGCFGACNFCAIAFHQGRSVRSRSIESVVEEAKRITEMPDFKGYIHDVGGPTANFRYPSCAKQKEHGMCKNKKCLAPTPCKQLNVSHSEYFKLLKEVEKLPKIKKVFIRSGIRFDYLVLDKDESFFKKLVRDHVSGQLKVAPEHCSSEVLRMMGKPDFRVYDYFKKRFFEITNECGKEQYLVPYLMSSHPGSTLKNAVELAVYLKKSGYSPEQVQDFYPTPGTASTVMFYTGIDPFTKKEVYVADNYEEKKMQRALLQWNKPENRDIVRSALQKCGRTDLIGFTKDCLVPPEKNGRRGAEVKTGKSGAKQVKASAYQGKGAKPSRKGVGLSGSGRKGNVVTKISGGSKNPRSVHGNNSFNGRKLKKDK